MNDLLLGVLTFFVFLSAVAFCIQAVTMIGIAKTTKELQAQVTSVLPQVRSVLSNAESTLSENRKNIADFTARANEFSKKANEIAAKTTVMAAKADEIMDLGKAQLLKIDVVMTDASDRAKVQLEHAELIVNDTISKVNQSVTSVHSGILKPVREVQGITAGVRAAMHHLMRGGRPSVADATHDDEMFIG